MYYMSPLKVQKRSIFLSICFAICLLFASAATTHAATFTVLNTNDSGAGSLRQAIIDANASNEDDVIDFELSDCPCVITLTTGVLSIASNDSLTVNGPGADQLSVSGNGTSGVFYIGDPFNVTNGITAINGITVTGSRGSGRSGIIIRSGRLALADSTVSGNSAQHGGGIFIDMGTLTLTNSTITDNSAYWGGGILNDGTLTLINSTVSGNSANTGGGIFNHFDKLTLINSTVTGNSATSSGGGIFLEAGVMTLNNTIIANSSGGDCGVGVYGSSFSDASYSLVEDGSCGLTGVGNLAGDPMLGPLQYNGGPTMTHALLLGSPTIDAGGATDLTSDQRGSGFDRVVGGAADIGSFEVQPPCSGIAFAPPLSVGTDDAPQAATAGDFNGDGRPDVATANIRADNVSVLLGGAGGFTAAVDFVVGDGPNSVTAGDFNGDGRLDLATANYVSGDISVLLGDGLGGFAGAQNFAAGNGPFSIVTGDFNTDSKLDLATSNYTSGNVSVLLGDGLGGFAAAQNFVVGDAPDSVTTGDFNQDGKLDLAVSNYLSGTISVLLGDGLGGLLSSTDFVVSEYSSSIAAGDFNGDGNLDLATANGSTGNVPVLLGDGMGSFATAVNFGVGHTPVYVTAGDFNGDGRPDIATANFGSANVSVLLSEGAGGFAAAVNFGAGDGPVFVTTGDFNIDGKLDLVTVNPLSDQVSVLFNSCTSNTAAPVANDDSYSTNEDTLLSGSSVLANDSDDENDTLSAVLISQAASGTVSLNPDGTFTYLPNANFSDTDSFTYKANDGSSDSNVATVSITVDPVNDAPVANPESYWNDEDTTVSGTTVLANDLDVDNDALTAVLLVYPANAQEFHLNEDGTFSYTPAANFTGTDSFTYIANDGSLDSNIATVAITLYAVNDAPVAVNDSYSTDEDAALAGNVLANDTDVEGDTLSAVLATGPTHGTVTLTADGSFSYTPAANFNGTDSFTYRANDGSMDSGQATVSITVSAVNDAPVVSVTPALQTVQYSDPIASVAVTATDVDAESLAFSWQANVDGGGFSNSLPLGLTVLWNCATGQSCTASLTGTPIGQAGVYTIRFTASDGVLSVSADHTLTVAKEHAETEYTGDVYALTAGPTVDTANVRLAAQLTQQADGQLGDITKAKVRFLLFKSGNTGWTPDFSVSGVPVDASGAALTFANLPVDIWTVKVKIDSDNGYWKANPVGMDTITIDQPTNELRTSGGGWVADSESVNGKGNFGFNVANQKKGVRGSSVYLFREVDGFNYLVKSTSWNNGGIGFNKESGLISLASFSGKCVVQKIDPATGDVVESFGNYSFSVNVRDGDLFDPRQSDKYAITILNSSGIVWRQVGAPNSPLIIGGGNVTVKGR